MLAGRGGISAPRTARRYRDGTVEIVPLDEVAVGDLLLVASGDVVPVDGTMPPFWMSPR